MSNNSDWKAVLAIILSKHNSAHSSRDKRVANRTIEARSQALYRWLGVLRRLGYDPDPRHLGGTHIDRLMEYWTANPVIAPRCKKKGVPMLDKPYSAAYIQQQLSILRVFAEWIGKPGMVRPPQHYVTDLSLVKRTYTAQIDKSWEGSGQNTEELISRVARIDEMVAIQLEMMWQFGLRRKEAVMFRPHLAVVPAHAIPGTHHACERYAVFIEVKRGTKGGRTRFAAIRTESQKATIERACRLAPTATSHLGQPNMTLAQALKRFDYVVRKAGITKQQLGITPHGLRHQFAGDLFFDLTDREPPVRRGKHFVAPEGIKAAYLEVAHQLGHARIQISNAYLGSPVRRRTGKTPGATPSQPGN